MDENKTKIRSIYNVVWQLMVLAAFPVLFFLTARISSLYTGWENRVQQFADMGGSCFAVLFMLLFAVWLTLFIKLKQWKNRSYDFVGMGTMLLVHYCIRVGMIGSLQMDEGLTCYHALNQLAQNPGALLNNFREAGKIAGRTAYGYNFFALMGEFLLPGTGNGFQWIQLFMGTGAACCLYGIFKGLFPKLRTFIAWTAAFVVSVQPMFLGFSTMLGLEYMMVVFFIYAFYSMINKKYLLMVFWLLMLGSTKGIGVIMALCFAGAFLLGRLMVLLKEKTLDSENKKLTGANIGIGAAALAVLAAMIWVTVKICMANGIGFSLAHFKIKLAQLFVLNFGWVWAIIFGIGIIMYIFNGRVRKTYKMEFLPVFILTVCYLVHTMYLLFYPKAALPRYDMLSDVVFVMLSLFLLIKMFERRKAIMSTLIVLGLAMYGEAFVTIDPVTTKVFTNIETNSAFPMAYTASFKSDQELAQDNAGDFGYYNYQYTFIDKAIDDILWRFNWYGDSRILSAYDGVETQFYYDDLMWDMDYAKRAYAVGGGTPDRYQYIGRINAFTLLEGTDFPARAVFIDSPWCTGYTEEAVSRLSEYYEIQGPMESEQGFAGSVIYYFLELKSREE